jgi:hypothetical protein
MVSRMGSRARLRRLLPRGARDEGAAAAEDVAASGEPRGTTREPLTQGHRRRSGGATLSAVTHRSPPADSTELPCCGRTLLEIQPEDQVTTDPTQVTCRG